MHTAYLFVLFASCAFAVPVPEDLALFSAGFLVRKGGVHGALIIFIAWIAVLTGDVTYFLLGRFFGPSILESKWLHRVKIGPALAVAQTRLRRWGPFACFLGRFIPGGRVPFYLCSGIVRSPIVSFICVDTIAVAISISGWMFLGHGFLFFLKNSPTNFSSITNFLPK
jgi:membrane protein DedA with SNARE-associated domain